VVSVRSMHPQVRDGWGPAEVFAEEEVLTQLCSGGFRLELEGGLEEGKTAGESLEMTAIHYQTIVGLWYNPYS
jgi:hypothetical protein